MINWWSSPNVLAIPWTWSCLMYDMFETMLSSFPQISQIFSLGYVWNNGMLFSSPETQIFSLPSLKNSTKYKLTAHEGSKIRRVGFVNFRSKSDERYQENDLAILTNQGDVQVWTIPGLRRQLKAGCVRKENVRWARSIDLVLRLGVKWLRKQRALNWKF